MFPDYQRLVLELYEQKKAANILSLRLIHPTPANIRDECTELIKAGIKKKDENILNEFVGARNDMTGYLQAIERCDIDKFRPLINFLKKPAINTAKSNIELLAWLINFEPRPWKMGMNYTDGGSNVSTEDEDDVTKAEIPVYKTGSPIIKPAEVGEAKPRKNEPRRRRLFIILGIALLCVCGYLVWIIKMGRESCMYWSIDHYERISCSKEMGTIPVIPYDADKERNFRKIMRPDTITYHSIGKVWYGKSKNNIEFFTSDGVHPLNPNLELKRITAYIIDKYPIEDSLQK